MLGAKLQAFFGRLNASNVRSCEGLPVVDERHLADSMRLVDEAQLNNGAIVTQERKIRGYLMGGRNRVENQVASRLL